MLEERAMNSTELDEALEKCNLVMYRSAHGEEIYKAAKAMSDLMKQIDEGKVAVVPTTPTIKMLCRDVDVSLEEGDAHNGFEGLKAAIKAADCELKKILGAV